MKEERPAFVQATATAVPHAVLDTGGLLCLLSDRISEGLGRSIRSLGVDRRYSVLENFVSFIAGGEEPKQELSTSDIALEAVERCLQGANIDHGRIGLLIAATNTPDRVLPCLASELMAGKHSRLPRTVNVVSMQGQGCSVLPKAVDVARWFLCENPEKLALVVLAEAHTPHMYRIEQREYRSFSEIKGESSTRCQKLGELRQTEKVIQDMLFGDGAVSILIGARETPIRFGKTCHLTNAEPDDFKLLLTPDRSSRQARASNDLCYMMSPDVPRRGVHYAGSVLSGVLDSCQGQTEGAGNISPILIHTGSRKILDGVCSQLGDAPDSPRFSASYDVLSQYGNLSSASIGFMLARNSFGSGNGVMVTFGAGFSASALEVSFN